MNYPKVSVIVPRYNVERYLDRCMSSLAKNTYDNKQIVFINDGSTDSTAMLLDSYRKYPFVKVIHKKNEGVSVARNTGMENADGKYIMFVDPDDYVEHNFILRASKEMEETGCDMIMFGFNTDWTGKLEPVIPLEHYSLSSNKQIIEKLFPRIYGLSLERFHNWLSGGGKLMPDKETGQVWRWIYRKSFLQKNNIAFEKIKVGEDMVFNAECLLAADSLKSIDDCLYNYFPRKDGLMYSNINGLNSLRNKFDMLEQRIRLGQVFESKTGEKALPLFGGSCIMSCFELAYLLSRTDDYKAFKSYVNNSTVQECISLSKIGFKNMKALIPYFLLKIRANLLLFCLFWSINKLNIKISY